MNCAQVSHQNMLESQWGLWGISLSEQMCKTNFYTFAIIIARYICIHIAMYTQVYVQSCKLCHMAIVYGTFYIKHNKGYYNW